MLSSKVAKRYAQGLLNFTQEAGSTDSVFAEMKDLVKTVEGSKELRSFFNSPIIDVKKKVTIATEIFKSFSQVSQNLIVLVIKHGRENQLQNIAQAYINKVEDLKGVQRISITSAQELSQANIDAILKSAELVNQANKVEVKKIINPEILGGYILRVGDQQVDTSVRSKLNNLKKEFQLN